MNRIVVVGGGITGLAAAHRLHEINQSINVTLLEASARLGGTIQTDYRDGFLLERGPDSFISEKPEALALAKRLGLESQLIETNETHRRSFIVRNGRLRTVPEGFQLLAPSRLWPFITSDIFSLAGKARMAADLFLPRKSTNGVSDESLASFVRRRLGEEALARMAQPMVGGIYTADPETLSLRATLPRFLDMEQQHRSLILAMLRQGRTQTTGTSGARYSLFLSFDKGMQVLVDALAHVKAVIRLNTRVETLKRGDSGWTITTNTGEQFQADAVCLALPAHTAASLLSDTNTQLAQKLNAITYASTATINFGYRRSAIKHPLNGFGFVVPFIEKSSLIACTFTSVKFSGRAPEDYVLLRAFAGGALQPEIFALDEATLSARVETDLRELLGINEDPLFVEVAKWGRSMPQYEVGHLDRVNEIEKLVRELPGFALAGNSYRGAGIPDCIRSGEAAAENLATDKHG
ncbi:MAG TPA: protoporphyrinogen oxidase [Pyrinomonadaceae bacterium]|jgi:oxygen-dependent protoporphyrinogen oxidase|nr:protoporphyrinogen oxidase [Pyrinomonadaceae bacterium]